MFDQLKNKTNSINLLSLVGGTAIAAATTLALTAGTASAGTLSFQVATAYDTDVRYDVQIKDLAANAGVQISVNQSATSPNSADLLGLFFNLNPGTASSFGITSSSFTKISGDAISEVCFGGTSCGGGNNVNGDIAGIISSFDIGLKLGSTGSSGGLVKTSVFSIASSSLTTANFLSQAFAVRAQSAGSNSTTGGSGSVKELGYAGSAIDTPLAPAPVPAAVPEPLTILGAATAAGFGASFKRRLAKAKGNQKTD